MTAEEFLATLDALVSRRLARIATAVSAAEPAKGTTVRDLLFVALKNEFEAAEEAAIWLIDERDVDVKLGLMRQCGDEAKHYRLIAKRLEELGADVATFDPMKGGYSPMFEHLRSLRSTAARLAAGPFAREALAGVRNEVFAAWCEEQGDATTAALYRDVIQPDEKHHHEFGRRLLGRIAVDDAARTEAREAVETTLALAEELQEIARLQKGIARAPGC